MFNFRWYYQPRRDVTDLNSLNSLRSTFSTIVGWLNKNIFQFMEIVELLVFFFGLTPPQIILRKKCKSSSFLFTL